MITNKKKILIVTSHPSPFIIANKAYVKLIYIYRNTNFTIQ